MSSALSLASVTAVLKGLLENGLAASGVTTRIGGDAAVSALPPDQIPSGADERAQLNLFLYSLTAESDDQGCPVRISHVPRGALTEYAKMEKQLTEIEVADWVPSSDYESIGAHG